MISAPSSKADATANVARGFSRPLHGARGLFAFMIVLFHVVNSRLQTFELLSHGAPLFMARSLEHGVELFFGISGVVIFGALSRARGPLIFATERATRIYPVLWASVIAIVALSGLTGFQGRSVPAVPVLMENLLALPPVFPGPLIHPAAWSLSFELVFYGVCALAWALRRRIGWWSLLLVAPAAIFLLGAHVRAVLMPVGMVLAAALAAKPHWSRYAPAPGLCLLVFLVAWEGVCQLGGGDLMHVDALQFSPAMILLAVAAVLAATLSFAGLLGGRGVFCAMLQSPPLQFLGSVSYSLYLWHPIVMSMVKHFMYVAHLPDHLGSCTQLAFLALSLPPSLALAWVSQHLLEKRVTVWLRRRLETLVVRRPAIRAPLTTTHPSGTRPAMDGRGP